MFHGLARPQSAVRQCGLLFLLFMVGVLPSSTIVVTPVYAQEEAAAPAAAPAANEPAAKPERQNMLVWLYGALGWRYTLGFLFLSMSLTALLIMTLLTARRNSICPPELIESFEALLNEKKYQEAYELAKNDDSFLGHVLAAGLSRLQSGYAKAIEAMQEVAEDENMKIDHRLSYISLIGSVSTMTGLLGTVDGMILSFVVIANSPTTPKPSELASGISMAMVTTLVGLVLAIPAICAFNIFRNRFQRLTLEVGIASESLMSRFENATVK